MSDLTLFELIIYCIITYTTFIFILYTSMTDVKITNSMSVLKIAFIVPALICSVFLANFGYQVEIYHEEGTIETSSYSEYMDNGNTIITSINDTSTTFNVISFELQNDIWVSFHGMLAIIFILYMFLTAIMVLANLKTP